MRCAATVIKVVSSVVAAIMPSVATDLADKLRSSATEAEPVSAQVAGPDVVEEAFKAVVVVVVAYRVEGAVDAGESRFEGDD